MESRPGPTPSGWSMGIVLSLILASVGQIQAADQVALASFVVPASANEDELLDFIVQVRRAKSEAQDRKAAEEHQKKVQQAVINAADELLKKELGDARLVWTIRTRAVALRNLWRMGDEASLEKLGAWANDLQKDERAPVAAEASLLKLHNRVLTVKKQKAVEQEQLFKDVDDLLARATLDYAHASLAMTFCEEVEAVNRKLAANAAETLASHFHGQKEPQLALAATTLAKSAARLHRSPNAISLLGTTIDGKPFDLANYQGKVVLVDFWASWCGPCMSEVPNMQANYNRYHKQGFEVVGVSLDDDKSKAQQTITAKGMPWIHLYSTDPARKGWSDPLVSRFSVGSIPFMLLIDQEGKIVSTNARGEELGRQLEKLLSGTKTAAR